MKTTAATVLLMLFTFVCFGQNHPFDYFGMNSPGEKIELFAPNIVSLKNSREASLAISPDGDEVFFVGGPNWPKCKIMHISKLNGQWTEPEIAEFSMDCYATEPAFSPDGKFLYYSSSKGMPDIMQYCIWKVEKIGDQWGDAKKVIDIPGHGIWEFHPSITNDGTIYFCYWDAETKTGSIYRSNYLIRITHGRFCTGSRIYRKMRRSARNAPDDALRSARFSIEFHKIMSIFLLCVHPVKIRYLTF